MASFTDSFSVCNFCMFGSACHTDANSTGGSNDTIRPYHEFCLCRPGFVHDAMYFHDPTCSMPANGKLGFFVFYTVYTVILVTILLWTDPQIADISFRDCCQWPWYVSSWFKRTGSASSMILRGSPTNSFLPPSLQAARGRRSSLVRRINRTDSSSQRHKDELRKLAFLVVLMSYVYILAVFVEDRAGIFANIAFCLLMFSLIAYMNVAVLYVVKPLFRVLGPNRFERMRRVIRTLLAFFCVMFIVVTGVWVSTNDYADLTDPSKETPRIRYNRVASFEALWATLFGLAFGSVLNFNITKLINKIKSTSSFRNGDVVMVANYGRLLKVRRQTWLVALNLIVAFPWLIFQWVFGVAPFFWAFLFVSFVGGPTMLVWFQYTLTKASGADSYHHQHFNYEYPTPASGISGQLRDVALDRLDSRHTVERDEGPDLSSSGVNQCQPEQDGNGDHESDQEASDIVKQDPEQALDGPSPMASSHQHKAQVQLA